MQPIDARPDELETVAAILDAYVPEHEVRAFGSRVRFTAREVSDLDLVIMTDQPLVSERLEELRDAFSESSLPFKVDVVDWAATGEPFRRIIERESVVLRPRPRTRPLCPAWPRAQVSDLIERRALQVGDGYRARNDELSDEGLPFARAGNVSGGFDFRDADRLPPADLAKVGDKVSRPGDVVFTSKGTVGRFAFVGPQTERFVYSPQLCFWRSLRPDEIDPRWLFYWMQSREFYAQYKSVAAQTDMAEYVSLGDQRRMHITLPPLQEQRAIAAVLGALDDKIELNRRLNAALEATAQALFKSWFVDFDPVRAKAEGRDPGLSAPIGTLFPDRFEDSELKAIPAGWTVLRVGDLADVVGGSTPSTTEAAYWDGGQHPWATPKDLSFLRVPVLLRTERALTDAGLAASGSGLLPLGTVLLSSRAPIGYLAVAEISVAINQGFIAMKPRAGVSSLFLLYWTNAFLDEIVSRANGSTFLEISKASFRPIPVVVPSEPVMAAFERAVRPLHARVVSSQREADTLTAIRDALLPRLVSGEIRLKDAERFVARHA